MNDMNDINKPKDTPHTCNSHLKMVKCDGESDTYQCTICKKEWVTRCNFDDDYS